MNKSVWLLSVLLVTGLIGSPPAFSQAFSSGSTGALEALNATSNMTIDVTPYADGVLNYTTITVASGVTVQFTANSTNTPVTCSRPAM
jgi:uncharacterized protein (UPF0333 family)